MTPDAALDYSTALVLAAIGLTIIAVVLSFAVGAALELYYLIKDRRK